MELGNKIKKDSNKRISRKSIFAINQANIDTNKMNLRNSVSTNSKSTGFKTGKITHEKPVYLNAMGTPERLEKMRIKKEHQNNYRTDSWKYERESYNNGYGMGSSFGRRYGFPVSDNLDEVPFTPIQTDNRDSFNTFKDEYTEEYDEKDTNDVLRDFQDENTDPSIKEEAVEHQPWVPEECSINWAWGKKKIQKNQEFFFRK